MLRYIAEHSTARAYSSANDHSVNRACDLVAAMTSRSTVATPNKPHILWGHLTANRHGFTSGEHHTTTPKHASEHLRFSPELLNAVHVCVPLLPPPMAATGPTNTPQASPVPSVDHAPSIEFIVEVTATAIIAVNNHLASVDLYPGPTLSRTLV